MSFRSISYLISQILKIVADLKELFTPVSGKSNLASTQNAKESELLTAINTKLGELKNISKDQSLNIIVRTLIFIKLNKLLCQMRLVNDIK